jgi:CubicO group peptidase (beta-lactamase class C family)
MNLNGKLEWAKGYGVQEIGGGKNITPETLFQAAFISKPVAAMAICLFKKLSEVNYYE